MTTVPSLQMVRGDRVLIEAEGQEDFIGIVDYCLGWGLVHKCCDWQMTREDDGSPFTYSIHIDIPVEILEAR